MKEENNDLINQENVDIESNITEPATEQTITVDQPNEVVEPVIEETKPEEIPSENIQVENVEPVQENIVNDIHLETPITETDKKEKKPFNKKLLFIVIGVFLMAIIAVILIIFVFGKNSKEESFKDPFISIDTKKFESVSNGSVANRYKIVDFKNAILTTESSLDEDLKSGVITPNEYVLQLAYKTFGDKKLSTKYKTGYISDVPSMKYLGEQVVKYKDKLDDATYAYLIQKLFLTNYVLGSDVEQTSSNLKSEQVSYLADNKILDRTLYKLNKVKLSADGNFLIYYATTGRIAVTDDYANKVSKYLEYTAKRYKELTGLDFKYSPFPNFTTGNPLIPSNADIYAKVGALLAANGISQDKALSAIPVYIVDTGDNGVLGYYGGTDNILVAAVVEAMGNAFVLQGNNPICEVIDCTLGQNINLSFATIGATYAIPFFVVSYNLENDDDLAFVSQHEFFHHYQPYICGNGKYKDCSSGLFTSETTANIMALLVKEMKNINVLNNHYVHYYLPDVEQPVDQVGVSDDESSKGYGAYVFAYNYMNIVPNGLNYLLESLKYTDPLEYLYTSAGNKYKDVMISLAEKNLTHNYDSISLLPIDDNGNMVNPPSHKVINIESQDSLGGEYIKKSSAHYYYIQNAIMFSGNQQISFDSKYDGLELLVLTKDTDKYNLVSKYDLKSKIIFNLPDFKEYNDVAFVVVNYSNKDAQYSYEYIKNSNLEAEKVDFSKNGITISDYELAKARSIYCKKNEDNSTSMTQKTEVLVNYKDSTKIKDMYVKETLDASGIDSSSPAYSLAHTLLDTSFKGIEQLFNIYFKDARTIYEKEDLKYSLTVKIPKEYFDNLGDVYNFEGNRKIDIINGLTEEGFTCYLK